VKKRRTKRSLSERRLTLPGVVRLAVLEAVGGGAGAGVDPALIDDAAEAVQARVLIARVAVGFAGLFDVGQVDRRQWEQHQMTPLTPPIPFLFLSNPQGFEPNRLAFLEQAEMLLKPFLLVFKCKSASGSF